MTTMFRWPQGMRDAVIDKATNDLAYVHVVKSDAVPVNHQFALICVDLAMKHYGLGTVRDLSTTQRAKIANEVVSFVKTVMADDRVKAMTA